MLIYIIFVLLHLKIADFTIAPAWPMLNKDIIRIRQYGNCK